MKSLFIILILFCSFECKSQKIYTLKPIDNLILLKYDTVRVLLLLCDTTLWDYVSNKDEGYDTNPAGTSRGITFETNSHPNNTKKYYDYSMFWLFGYEIRVVEYKNVDVAIHPIHETYEGIWFDNVLPRYETHLFYTHLEYLMDMPKCPFPKSFIIWDSKIIMADQLKSLP